MPWDWINWWRQEDVALYDLRIDPIHSFLPSINNRMRDECLRLIPLIPGPCDPSMNKLDGCYDPVRLKWVGPNYVYTIKEHRSSEREKKSLGDALEDVACPGSRSQQRYHASPWVDCEARKQRCSGHRIRNYASRSGERYIAPVWECSWLLRTYGPGIVCSSGAMIIDKPHQYWNSGRSLLWPGHAIPGMTLFELSIILAVWDLSMRKAMKSKDSVWNLPSLVICS